MKSKQNKPYGNMRLLLILVTIAILSEAKKKRRERKKKIVPPTDESTQKEEVYPRRFIPVPFGHIFKEGFQPQAKLPVDLLELVTNYTGFSELRDKPKDNTQERPRGFASSKDSFFFGDKADPEENVEIENKDGEKNSKIDDKKLWHDLAANHVKNLAMTRQRRPHDRPQIPKDTPPEEPSDITKENFFTKNSFRLQSKRHEEVRRFNWTTCDEFGRNADFHPKDVINRDWVPFYSWSTPEAHKSIAFVHRFSFPTVKLVQKYKENISPYLNKSLNWEGPKLYMKADMEMLLISIDRKGEFEGLPYHEVPKSMKGSLITLPSVNLRLKIVDPYLAMMLCDYQYATIMAVSGNEPTRLGEIRTEAALLKFKGRGYPVVRDRQAEKMRMEYERKMKIEKEKDMFIEIEDQAEDHFPFE